MMLIKCHACGRVITTPIYGAGQRPYGPVCAIKKGLANVAKLATLKRPVKKARTKVSKVRSKGRRNQKFGEEDQMDLFSDQQL